MSPCATHDNIHDVLMLPACSLTACMQVAAAEAWATVVRERLMHPSDLSECLLPPALAALRDNREDGTEVIAAACWSHVCSASRAASGAVQLGLAVELPASAARREQCGWV